VPDGPLKHVGEFPLVVGLYLDVTANITVVVQAEARDRIAHGARAQQKRRGRQTAPFPFVLSVVASVAPALESSFSTPHVMPTIPNSTASSFRLTRWKPEQSVLGGLLLVNEATDRIGDLVSDADFYSDGHRLVYRTSSSSSPTASRRTWSPCRRSLASLQKLDYIGGLAYLGALVENVPTAPTFATTRRSCATGSILRQLAGTAGEIADSPTIRSSRRQGNPRPGRSEDPAHREQGERGTRAVPKRSGKLLG
jgi:hypothetical protein